VSDIDTGANDQSGGSPGPAAAPPVVPAAAAADDVPAGVGAKVVAGLFGLGSLVFAWFVHASATFEPRVETIDALAGLSVGAFVVDRVLTFIPPAKLRNDPLKRAADLRVLRFGYGAVVGAIFVGLTNLQVVHVLAPGAKSINEHADRAIAVLAIAGGVVGLARLLDGINPQPATKGTPKAGDPPEDAATEGAADGVPVIDPPSAGARVIGFSGVAIAAALALVVLAIGDENGVDLIEPQKAGDGTVALAVRFGLVILAAGIVVQVAEVLSRGTAKPDKPLLTGAISVVLGVAAARVLDLYLLHNLGFFGTGKDLNAGIKGSTDLALWGDTFVTGLVIAAGTKPLHDLSARLKTATPKPKPAAS
jgi:hypothetical protein